MDSAELTEWMAVYTLEFREREDADREAQAKRNLESNKARRKRYRGQ